MPTYVVDIETDGLRGTKVHVLSAGYKTADGWKVVSTDDPENMKKIMENPKNTVVGHFFKLFDAPELNRLLGIEINATIIDTLALAWYIYPEKGGQFGLEWFGEKFGIEKPKIDDWQDLSYEEYAHRCERDVQINIKLWEEIQERLNDLYDGDSKKIDSLIRYLMFKMDCVADQHEQGVKLDLEKVRRNRAILEELLTEKVEALVKAMPPGNVIKRKPAQMHKIVKKNAPKVMYKADGSLSKAGERWMEYLESKGLPEDTTYHEEKHMSANAENWYQYLRENKLPATTEEHREPGNPGSNNQVKEWLFSLGWEPQIFNDGANGPVPQVRNADKELCKSVLALAEDHPAIHYLDGYTVIKHRLDTLKGFEEKADEDGYVIADMAGFTNTLRLRHSKPIVNLPGVTGAIPKGVLHIGNDNDMKKVLRESVEAIRDGALIRECIVAPKGYELCGSDITSLEDNTKRHYMFEYDPEYVEEQMAEGFDPHLDLAVRAGALTEEQAQAHKDKKEDHKATRHLYKTANYSCIYGVGAVKLSKTLNITTREAKKLIEAYWNRNWSVKMLSRDTVTKTSGESMWLWNPVNGFYYSVRSEKDIFSTLNQGTGAFVFDLWVKFMRQEGVFPILQYHDEMLTLVERGQREEVTEILESSMERVNEMLNLNVNITVDVQFGDSYADVH